MNTGTTQTNMGVSSPLRQLAANVRSLFFRFDRASEALAASLASELRTRPELPRLVLSLTTLPSRCRHASLLEKANALRGEWETFGAADALKRMATRPSLFKAVARELHGTADSLLGR